MRYVDRAAIVLAGVLGWCSPAAPAQQPTTQPAMPTARILVLPFSVTNGSEATPWLGKSIQQSLLADLTPAAPGRLLSADSDASDTAAAVSVGRTNKADYVVIGSFTTIEAPTGKQLRIVGQLVDVTHETALSGFKVTGMYADIFPLEDQVGKQIRRRLSDAGAIITPVISVGPAVLPEQQPAEVAQLPAANEYEQAYGSPQLMVGGANDSAYNYYFGNPGYGAGFDAGTGFGYPLFIFGNGGFRGYGGRGFGNSGFRDGGFGHSHNTGAHSGGSRASGSVGASHGHR